MAVWLSLCVNDGNGNITHTCHQIDIEIAGDTAMEIECELSFWEYPNQRIRINGVAYPYNHRGAWAGSMAWNTYAVPMVDVVALCNRLKADQSVNLLAAWQPLWDKWHSDEPLTREDFEE